MIRKKCNGCVKVFETVGVPLFFLHNFFVKKDPIQRVSLSIKFKSSALIYNNNEKREIRFEDLQNGMEARRG
jgi:hypothetical protein